MSYYENAIVTTKSGLRFVTTVEVEGNESPKPGDVDKEELEIEENDEVVSVETMRTAIDSESICELLSMEMEGSNKHSWPADEIMAAIEDNVTDKEEMLKAMRAAALAMTGAR
tara:strand:+ start:361 stop:699 length:339 start_codon:yes stop_codon:yes gene_type:complete